jgi:flagellar operon protein
MVHRINHLQHFPPLQVQQTKKTVQKENLSFKEILDQQQGLKISKHAQKRLAERNIELNDQQMKMMSEKVNEAKQKGITDSLVLFNHAAFVVNTNNDTIVTALDLQEANSKIFTNINGTILLNE